MDRKRKIERMLSYKSFGSRNVGRLKELWKNIRFNLRRVHVAGDDGVIEPVTRHRMPEG